MFHTVFSALMTWRRVLTPKLFHFHLNESNYSIPAWIISSYLKAINEGCVVFFLLFKFTKVTASPSFDKKPHWVGWTYVTSSWEHCTVVRTMFSRYCIHSAAVQWPLSHQLYSTQGAAMVRHLEMQITLQESTGGQFCLCMSSQYHIRDVSRWDMFETCQINSTQTTVGHNPQIYVILTSWIAICKTVFNENCLSHISKRSSRLGPISSKTIALYLPHGPK